MSKLQNKVAVITGGNSGIGYATAKKMKEDGAKVIITGRSEERVATAASELGVTGIVADVLDLNAMDSLVAKVKATVGNVDILFANAGTFLPTPVGQLSEEVFDTQMGINFKGAVFTTEKFEPILNDGASIINLSSVLAHAGMANGSIYSASKAALNAYTRSAATELASRGIRVNSVLPGPIDTPIYGKTGMDEEQLNGFAQAILKSVPLKRFGHAEEVAKLVSFLASDDAAFITGGEYTIDGGIIIHPLVS